MTQKFEGIVECNNITINDIIYNNPNDPNIVKVMLTGADLDRVAAVKVLFEKGNSFIETGLLSLEKINNMYSANVNLLDLTKNSNFSTFIGVDVDVKVIAYYDSGIIGFEPENRAEYSAFMNSNNMYLTLNDRLDFIEGNSITGNIFKYQLFNNY